jgi:hypothetical protein
MQSRPLLEKKPRGCQWPPDFCCIMPTTWTSEASLAKESSALEKGCWSGTVRYHSGGSMKLNACILLRAHMVYL